MFRTTRGLGEGSAKVSTQLSVQQSNNWQLPCVVSCCRYFDYYVVGLFVLLLFSLSRWWCLAFPHHNSFQKHCAAFRFELFSTATILGSVYLPSEIFGGRTPLGRVEESRLTGSSFSTRERRGYRVSFSYSRRRSRSMSTVSTFISSGVRKLHNRNL